MNEMVKHPKNLKLAFFFYESVKKSFLRDKEVVEGWMEKKKKNEQQQLINLKIKLKAKRKKFFICANTFAVEWQMNEA